MRRFFVFSLLMVSVFSSCAIANGPKGKLIYCSYASVGAGAIGTEYCELIADPGTDPNVVVVIDADCHFADERRCEYPVDAAVVDSLDKTPLDGIGVYLNEPKPDGGMVSTHNIMRESWDRKVLEPLVPIARDLTAHRSMKESFIGRTGIFDHDPSSSNQNARIYSTEIVTDDTKSTSDGRPYKYLKAEATDDEAETQWAQAKDQVRRYATDEKLHLLCGSTQLHLVVAQFRSHQLMRSEEIA